MFCIFWEIYWDILVGGFLGDCKGNFKLEGFKLKVYEGFVFGVFSKLYWFGDMIGLVNWGVLFFCLFCWIDVVIYIFECEILLEYWLVVRYVCCDVWVKEF